MGKVGKKFRGIDNPCECCVTAGVHQYLHGTCVDGGVVPLNYDMVDHPLHYNMGKYEVYDVIEDWKLSYNLGNVVKYVARSPHKGKQLEDLKKAQWYLNKEVERLERDQ